MLSGTLAFLPFLPHPWQVDSSCHVPPSSGEQACSWNSPVDFCQCFSCQNHVTWPCWAGAWSCLLSRLCGRGGEEEERGRGRRVQRVDGPTYRILLMDQLLGPPWTLSGQDKGWGNKGQEGVMGINNIKELTCKFCSQTEEIWGYLGW